MFASLERKALTPADLHLELLQQAASKTGLRVTWQTALQASTAFSCARVIAEGIAQIPLKLYLAGKGGGAEPATDHPLYGVIANAPNDWLTSFEWRETAGLQLVITNRAYAFINRTSQVLTSKVELLPLCPEHVRTERLDSHATRYWVRFSPAGPEEEVPAEKILHLRGPSWNSWEGLDGVRLAREAIGLALATEEHGSRLFKNGAIIGGTLSTDAVLNKTQQEELRASWELSQSGLSNAYKTAVLWGGLKWTPRAMQNDQAQWIEVRRFQVAEVCRFYRVLPIIIGEADKTATYASSEQMFLAHVLHTMQPWYRRIEDRLNLQLLTEKERDAGYFFRFNMAGLLRGSHRDRAEFYRVMHGLGAFNANEIRALEEMNPYAAGDTYLQPLNMVPAGTQPAGGNP
jgi:HK97 family phage portal protein